MAPGSKSTETPARSRSADVSHDYCRRGRALARRTALIYVVTSRAPRDWSRRRKLRVLSLPVLRGQPRPGRLSSPGVLSPVSCGAGPVVLVLVLGRSRQRGGTKEGGRCRSGSGDAIEALAEPDAKGDPESPTRWTLRSNRQIAEALSVPGHRASSRTVAHVMVDELGYSLQANRSKDPSTRTVTPSSTISTSRSVDTTGVVNRWCRSTPRRRSWSARTRTQAVPGVKPTIPRL